MADWQKRKFGVVDSLPLLHCFTLPGDLGLEAEAPPKNRVRPRANTRQ